MRVHELLDKPEKWSQGSFARNSDGLAVQVSDSKATCWCVTGAVLLCYAEEYDVNICKLQNRLDTAVMIWNDAPERTFEEVRAVCLELNI